MASATSLKAQMKKADKSGAALTVIIVQQELDQQMIGIKDMQNGSKKTCLKIGWRIALTFWVSSLSSDINKQPFLIKYSL